MRFFVNTQQSDAPGFYVMSDVYRARQTENYLELEYRVERGGDAPVFVTQYSQPLDDSTVLCGVCFGTLMTPVAFLLWDEDSELGAEASAKIRELLPLSSRLLENGKSPRYPALIEPTDPDDGQKKWFLCSVVTGLANTADDNAVLADPRFEAEVNNTLQLAAKAYDEFQAANWDVLNLMLDRTVGPRVPSKAERALEQISKSAEEIHSASHALDLLRVLSGAG
jgi:hypothetical protein